MDRSARIVTRRGVSGVQRGTHTHTHTHTGNEKSVVAYMCIRSAHTYTHKELMHRIAFPVFVLSSLIFISHAYTHSHAGFVMTPSLHSFLRRMICPETTTFHISHTCGYGYIRCAPLDRHPSAHHSVRGACVGMAWSEEHCHCQKYHHCCHEDSYGKGSTTCIRSSTSAMLHMHGVLPRPTQYVQFAPFSHTHSHARV